MCLSNYTLRVSNSRILWSVGYMEAEINDKILQFIQWK